jgi:hypothetical protein
LTDSSLQTEQSAELLALVEQLQGAIVTACATAPETDDLETTVRLYQQLQQLKRARELYNEMTGSDHEFFDPSALETRERSFALITEATVALDAGRPHTAARRAMAAAALDPGDAHAGRLNDRLVASLAGIASQATVEAERERFQPPPRRHIADARAFVALADAEQVSDDPTLLTGWARAFKPDDAATLALIVAPHRLAAVQPRLEHALNQAGLDAEGGYDLALVPTDARAISALAHEAQATLTADRDRVHPSLAGLARFDGSAASTHALRAAAQSCWSGGAPGRPLGIAIKIPAPTWSEAQTWGDSYFALQFARELQLRGHRARLDIVDEWDEPARGDGPADDVVIHLRGPFPYVPRATAFNVLWNISRPSRVTRPECDAFDLIAAPSARRAEELSQATRTPVIVLPQATDPANCWPEPVPALAHELTFVANTRGVFRQIIQDLLPTDHDLAIWGAGWRGLVPDRHIVSDSLPNDQLRRAYSSAAIVLNDHMDDQRRYGIVNNRTYDVLACGGCVLSDHLPELEDSLPGVVPTYRTAEELHTTIARLLADPAERRERSTRGREMVLSAHTFGHRADTLLQAIADHI